MESGEKDYIICDNIEKGGLSITTRAVKSRWSLAKLIDTSRI